MSLFYKILLAATLLPAFSFAQASYQPGKIVTQKGDTVHGFINVREWENNPKSISFRTDSSASATRLTANSIKYFGVYIGFLQEYRGYEGPLSTNSTDNDHITAERDSSYSIDTVFLKVIQKGKNMVLYSYSDNLKTRFFISENFYDTPKELVYRVYFNSTTSAQGRTVYEKTYIQQLYAIGLKSNVITPPLMNELAKAEYSEGDLINIAGKINGITDQQALKNGLSHPKPYKLIVALTGFVIIAIIVLSTAINHGR